MNTNYVVFAPGKDLDQPGHPPSLINLPCLHKESLSTILVWSIFNDN